MVEVFGGRVCVRERVESVTQEEQSKHACWVGLRGLGLGCVGYGVRREERGEREWERPREMVQGQEREREKMGGPVRDGTVSGERERE